MYLIIEKMSNYILFLPLFLKFSNTILVAFLFNIMTVFGFMKQFDQVIYYSIIKIIRMSNEML